MPLKGIYFQSSASVFFLVPVCLDASMDKPLFFKKKIDDEARDLTGIRDGHCL